MSDHSGIKPVIYGKHPAFGDFLAHGMDHAHLSRLDTWLEGVLPPLRDGMGEMWEANWRAAPPLRFWMGPDVIGRPFMGIFLASRDKVGRRFPLFFGLTGIIAPPPVHTAHQEAAYDALLAHIQSFEVPESGTKGAATLLEGFEAPDVVGTPFEEGQDGVLWGSRGDGDLARLFKDARSADADKAQLGRSHWWQAALPERASGWLAVNGLPDVDAMTWLLTERGRAVYAPTPPAPEPEVVAPNTATADTNEQGPNPNG